MKLRRERPHGPAEVVRWGPQDLLRHIHVAMSIYAEAMAYPPQMGAAHVSLTATHASRAGFRATAALADGELIGFGYGYQVQNGQWWFDQVRRAASDSDAEWLQDSFELCELHVSPGWQGNGIGRELLTTLVADLPQKHVVLSTPEGPTRAWSLYRSVGFTDVLRNYYFTGDSRPFAVLGAELPLQDQHA